MSAPVPSRFRIVPRDVAVRRRGTSLLLGLAWLASLGAVWFVASHTAAPRLAQADAALYRAKAAGRNRVVAGPGPAGGLKLVSGGE